MENILPIVIQIGVVLFAITVHEASHGWAAYKMGDPTAYASGRVTLNPVAHIDPIGTILMPLLLLYTTSGRFTFGWAKPVPVNPYNLRHPRKDGLWISLAGPAANIATAAVSLVIILIVKSLRPDAIKSMALFLFPSLRETLSIPAASVPHGFSPVTGIAVLLYFLIFISTYFAAFNLIPVPPLDGSGILSGLLSSRAAEKYELIRPYGFIIVIALVYLRVLDVIVGPVQALISRIIFSHIYF